MYYVYTIVLNDLGPRYPYICLYHRIAKRLKNTRMRVLNRFKRYNVLENLNITGLIFIFIMSYYHTGIIFMYVNTLCIQRIPRQNENVNYKTYNSLYRYILRTTTPAARPFIYQLG